MIKNTDSNNHTLLFITALPPMLRKVGLVCAGFWQCAKSNWAANDKRLPNLKHSSYCIRLRARLPTFSLVGSRALRSFPSGLVLILMASATLQLVTKEQAQPPLHFMRPAWAVGSLAFRGLEYLASPLHVPLPLFALDYA